MKFVDTVEIDVIGGHGGPGKVSFRREKYVPRGGPDGGNGGLGGSVILKASEKVQTLLDLKLKRIYKAKAGAPGKPKDQSGSSGEDLILEVPVGTIVLDDTDTPIADLTQLNETLVVAKGGLGGRGNAKFATSINRAPRKSQPGLPGEEQHIRLELKLIAQVGLVGLPNAGKSTMLKSLTAANPKIGNYPFTTLYPNLGVLKFSDSEIVIADIPGIIEGASDGLGLGIEFLRHIARTKVIVHLISLELGNFEACWNAYNTIMEELKKSKEDILSKPQMIVLSKSDLVTDEDLETIVKKFAKRKLTAISVSAVTLAGLDNLKNLIYHTLQD